MNNLKLDKATHLYVCFLEEISELLEAYTENDNTNFILEYYDLIGVIELLNEYNDFNQEIFFTSNKQISIKEIQPTLLRIQKMICKSLRFGHNDSYPNTSTTNLEHIKNDLNILFSIVLYNFSIKENREKIDNKKKKVLKFIDYAKDKGTLV